MSNIYTSYVRFYRNDRKKLETDEVEFIVQSIVKVHDHFGSYNVPIIIDNNIKENYLDIQYGSGKGRYHLSDFADDYENKYTIWERFNDDGLGIDQIERLYHYQKEIPEYDSRNCNYSFDELKVIGCSQLILKKTSFEWITIKNELIANVSGYYLTDNGQFLRGQLIQIDASDRFNLPREFDELEFCSNKEINDLIADPPEKTDFEIQFYYCKRLVTKFRWTKGEGYDYEFKGLAFDDWDNCTDDQFLIFHNDHKLHTTTNNHH